jgi:hypothetical protein
MVMEIIEKESYYLLTRKKMISSAMFEASLGSFYMLSFSASPREID